MSRGFTKEELERAISEVVTCAFTSRFGMDNLFLQISSVQLDRPLTYLLWAKNVRLFIKAHGLEGFLTGAKSQPPMGDTAFVQWESENSLVMAWLINSMVLSIAQGMSLFEIA